MRSVVPHELKGIRQLLSQLTPSKYETTRCTTEKVLSDITEQLVSGSDDVDRTLAHFFFCNVVLNKVLRKDSNGEIYYMFKPSPTLREASTAQIFLFDKESGTVLLQQRGPYKRLFPDKFTVTANAKIRWCDAEKNNIGSL